MKLPPRRRTLRWIYGAAACLLLAFSIERVLFATPLFINLFKLAFAGQVQVNYSSAWSVFPGRLHVKDLELTGEDDNVQWKLQIDQVDFAVSIPALLHREFHATHVNARGVVWGLRSKQLLLDVTPDSLYGLPPIAGFPAMALKPYGPPELDSDATYHLWTIHLDHVAAREVREVWIEKLHLAGNAQITGGFFLRPMRQLRVEAQVQAEPLELLIGDDVVARELRGRLAVTVNPFDIRAHGPIVPVTDVSVAMTGELGDLGFLKRELPPEITISAAPGPLKLDAVLRGGVLQPGSHIDVSTPHLHAAKAPFLADTALQFTLDASAADASGRTLANAAVELTAATIAVERSRAAPFQAKRLRLGVLSRTVDLAKPLGVSGFSADVDEAKLPDLKLLEALLPADSKLRIEGGTAEAHGHIDSSDEYSTGGLQFGVSAARLTAKDTHLRTDASGELRVHGHDPTDGPMDLSGSHFEIDRASVSGAGGDDWWGHFVFPKASLNLTDKNVSLDLNAHCLDSRPLRALFAIEGVPGFVATLFTMPGMEIKGALRLAPKTLRLTDLDVHGEGASIRANYLAKGEEKRGEALVKLGIATAGLDLDGGKTHVVLLGASSWFDDRTRKADVAKATGAMPAR